MMVKGTRTKWQEQSLAHAYLCSFSLVPFDGENGRSYYEVLTGKLLVLEQWEPIFLAGVSK